MNFRYQVILIGSENSLREKILGVFFDRVKELGLDGDTIEILGEDNFSRFFKGNSPGVALYFGGVKDKWPNLDIAERLIEEAIYILPLVSDLKATSQLIPEILHPINAFHLSSELEIESLVNNMLECLGLLRLARRIFISYRRTESRDIAIQLFERLESAGFDVFLDTHSIRPGDVFQDELWHRMVDCEVVVILNTPDFLSSVWTKEEVAKASAMSIGMLQVVWPEVKPERMAELTQLFILSDVDFVNSDFKKTNSQLNDAIFGTIVERVESLRARNLASRQDNIITEFISKGKEFEIIATLQKERIITIKTKEGKEIILIPTIGVPHAFTYNQSKELVKRIRSESDPQVYLLYDHRHIREKWIHHLGWLDEYLPIQSVKITELTNWFKKLLL
jgi:TIR domain